MKYSNLILMGILSFISMYILMYMMVDRFANVFPNYNQFYMAAMMTAPMIIIELFLMRSMYMDRKLNIIIIILSLITLVLSILFIRKQILISDKQFLKSMIPHHAAAILMCKNAPLKDPEIKDLCKNIVKSQQAEIDFMQSKLKK